MAKTTDKLSNFAIIPPAGTDKITASSGGDNKSDLSVTFMAKDLIGL